MHTPNASRPASLLQVLLAGIVGIVAPLALSQLAATWDLPPVGQGRDAITAGIGLSAVMLIPPSVFAAAVGAVFPNHDRATPVTVIDDSAFGWLVSLVTVGVFFGGSVLGFDLAATSLLIAAFGIVVGGALVLSAWLVQHSLSILDPDRLSAFLADRATHHPVLRSLRRPDPNQPFRDLCRVVRGYLDRQRPMAAANAIDRMTDVWRVQGERVNKDSRSLAARVLGEGRAREHWHQYLAGPTTCFVSVSGVEPDASSEAVARRRLRCLEPWLLEHNRDRPLIERALIRLIKERYGLV